AGLFFIAGGVIAKRMSDVAPCQLRLVVVRVNQFLRLSPRRTEEYLVGRRDRDYSALGVRATLAPFPYIGRLNIGKDLETPTGLLLASLCRRSIDIRGRGVIIKPPRGKRPQRIVVGMEGEADLFQIVLALDAIAGFPNLLHGGQKQPNEN